MTVLGEEAKKDWKIAIGERDDFIELHTALAALRKKLSPLVEGGLGDAEAERTGSQNIDEAGG